MTAIQPFFHLPIAPLQGVPADLFDAPRTVSRSNTAPAVLSPYGTQFDDEFEGAYLDKKWKADFAAGTSISHDDKVRSALYLQIPASATDFGMSQTVQIAGDFSATVCCSIEMTNATHNLYLSAGEVLNNNQVTIQAIYSSGAKIRTDKTVAGTFSQVDITATLTYEYLSPLFMHIQRSGNNWTFYYSNDGTVWVKFGTTISLTFPVNRISMGGGPNGTGAKTQIALHFFRINWLTLA